MSTKKEKTMPAEKKHIKKLIEGQLSTRQKVAKGFGIALVVIAALWGAFAAPIAVTYGGAPEAAIGFLFLALFFFLVSLPFLYLGRKRLC